jgi:hypothetical protein
MNPEKPVLPFRRVQYAERQMVVFYALQLKVQGHSVSPNFSTIDVAQEIV